MLLPIVVSYAGVSQFPWVDAWITNRKACGLPTSGFVEGAMMLAPFMGDCIEWMKRHLSAGEVTGILKGFLKCDDDSLSSHSLKATALSWAAKAEGLVTRGESLDGLRPQSRIQTRSTAGA